MTDVIDKAAMAQQIGQRLAKSRLNAGIEYAITAAAELGVSNPIYLCYERGERLDVLAKWMITARKLGKLYDISPAYLLGLIDEPVTEADLQLRMQLGRELLGLIDSKMVRDQRLFVVRMEHDMEPHKRGELLFFESGVMPAEGGRSELYSLRGRHGDHLLRWISPTLSGGFTVSDGVSKELVTQEQLAELGITGRYKFKLTDF